MDRYIVGSLWNRTNRNGINDNFQFLFQEQAKYANIRKEAEQVLSEAKNTNAKNQDVQKQIDNLILSDGESDAEVINARGGHTTLRGRLEDIEGNHEDNKNEVIQARGSHGALHERFEDIEGKRGDYNFSVNSSIPPKLGLTENSFKLVRKISNDQLEVFQKTSKGYLRYLYQRGIGGNGSGDYGENHEALRLIKVEPISDIITFKKVDKPKSGTVKKAFDFDEPHLNTTVEFMFDGYKKDKSKLFYPTGNNVALEPYEVNPNSSVTYDLNQTYGAKNTVTFFYRRNGSGLADHDVNIKVNGYLVKKVTLTMSFEQSSLTIDIPTYDRATPSSTTLEVTIENKASYPIHLLGFNLSTLSENRGQEVDNFLAVGSTLPSFIDDQGASDYAMKNAENGKNFGSYHGGEVSNRCDVMWRKSYLEDYSYERFDNLTVGEFCVAENFSIKKIGILISRAYMHTNESFNTDGTVHMTNSYQVMDDRTPIPFIDFWTTLTCTSPDFTLIRQPVYKNLRNETQGHKYFKSTEGLVIQETADGSQELHSRFTRFNNEYVGVQEANSVSVQNQYNKHYYAPIRNNTDKTIAPEVLQFTKALDFYVY